MKTQRFNWQIWVGFLLSVAGLLTYPFVFVRFPVTRDFPWANLLLFGIAVVLLFVGVRRAWKKQKPNRDATLASPVRYSRWSRIVASILATLSVLILGVFVFAVFIAARWLPAAHGAPAIGQKAPSFTLANTNGKPVSLSELLSAPINDKAASANPRGVLLIFYRGYW